ncbi:MAG: type I restriction enzyme HsdR N-terminal domain-containing protein [Rhodothermales bacterium]|nr:type I restriction enzyme HsdR N-terminal domain-containing protein [Rhodothermales bacterium]MBO6781366.1 type I restriction enzyme HsdR N-terminal domain-containing protein [Rhodothermales bacterium]
MSNRPALRLEQPELRIRDGRVLDLVRRRWVVLTPEEWVRQHTMHFLLQRARAPHGLLSVEKAHHSHAGARRTDVTVYARDGSRWMVVECKAPDVRLAQSSLDQVARYARELKPRYIAVTNGMSLYCAERVGDRYAFVPQFPEYPDIESS